jgi:hypothetical protein
LSGASGKNNALDRAKHSHRPFVTFEIFCESIPAVVSFALTSRGQESSKIGLKFGRCDLFHVFSFQFATCFAKRIGWFRSSIVWMIWKLESHSIYESRVALLRFNRIRGPISRIYLFSRG